MDKGESGMSDLEKLTTDELLHQFRYKSYNMKEWAEIRRRLERLEKCEAALRDLVEKGSWSPNDPQTKAARAALEDR